MSRHNTQQHARNNKTMNSSSHSCISLHSQRFMMISFWVVLLLVLTKTNHGGGGCFVRQVGAFTIGVTTKPFRRLSNSMFMTSSNSNMNNETQSSTVSLLTNTNSTSTNNAQFGQAVPLRRPQQQASVPSSSSSSSLFPTTTTTTTTTTTNNYRRNNIAIAVTSITLAISNYLWQWFHPVLPITILASMQQDSVPLQVIGRNQKPTLVDFWAPWCENCKLMASTLQAIEQEYDQQVNFVMINGDDPASWPAIEAFHVDAIPHLALVSASGDVQTALIGPIPKRILEDDLNVLLENAAACSGRQEEINQKEQSVPMRNVASAVDATTETSLSETTIASTAAPSTTTTGTTCAAEKPLPYTMLDVFENRPQQRRIKFD